MADVPEAIRRAVDFHLLNLHTAMPARIEEYDADERKAKVQPLVMKAYADGVVKSMPPVFDVPVLFPRSAAASFALKVAKGDTCLLVCCERSIERWAREGGEQEPGKPRRHSLSDAVAIPGLWPFNEAGPEGEGDFDFLLKAGLAEVSAQDGVLTMKSGDISVVLDSGEITVTGVSEVSLTDGTAAFKVAGGKIAMGAGSNEVMTILSTLLQTLAAEITSSPGSPFSGAATYTLLKTQIDAVKGTL